MPECMLAPTRERAALRLLTTALSIAALCVLGACKTLSNDGGMDAVAGIAGDALNKDVVAVRTPEEASAVRARVGKLLRRPLSADAAVQVALLNNRGLQAAYNELAAAEAQMVEASLPPAPTFSLDYITGAVETEIERRIVADILALATLPARTEIAEARFRAAQLGAAAKTLALAATTRRAFYRAVAAQEQITLSEQAASAAQSTAALAKRLGESGAMNKLDQTRQQAFAAESAASLARARLTAAAEREHLTRALGLGGDGDPAFRIPAALPPLPAHARNLRNIESEALAHRIDLSIARIELDALAKSYGLTKATRFINAFDVAADSKTTIANGQHIRELGPNVELQIPLFDFGEARTRGAEATYMAAVDRLAEAAVNARSQAREAYQGYRSRYALAVQYRDQVLPLRQIISDETTLRYNAMMIDVFGLLTEARQSIASQTNALEARRDFWLAAVDLDAAILGGGPSEPTSDPMAATAAGNSNDQ
jgi:outer membrane protein TolC